MQYCDYVIIIIILLCQIVITHDTQLATHSHRQRQLALNVTQIYKIFDKKIK